jgi:RNA polymerase subunit RPABC4/transcription elongation factor Spt4
MKIALIKNSLCINVVIFESMEAANQMFGSSYFLIECPDGFGSKDYYIDGTWRRRTETIIKICPVCGNNVLAEAEICPVCKYNFES